MTNGNSIKTTKYLDGFQYNKEVQSSALAGSFVKIFLKDFLTLRPPMAEGYVKATYISQSGYYKFNYVYNYTDHLGNIRLSYNQEPFTDQLKVLEENHYYPFGLKHPSYALSFVLGGRNPYQYKYKYNGKEFQDELNLNLYDYGARNYDPAIGRWMNTDPLAEQMRRYSPYNYAFNNPIFFIDPDGMTPGVNDSQNYSYPPEGYSGKYWADSSGFYTRNNGGGYDRYTLFGEKSRFLTERITLQETKISHKAIGNKVMITDIPSDNFFSRIFGQTKSETYYVFWGSGDGEIFRDAPFFREGKDRVRYSDLMDYLGAFRGSKSKGSAAFLGSLGNFFDIFKDSKKGSRVLDLNKINSNLVDPFISVSGPLKDSVNGRMIRYYDGYFDNMKAYPDNRGDTTLYGRESERMKLLHKLERLAPDKIYKKGNYGTFIESINTN